MKWRTAIIIACSLMLLAPPPEPRWLDMICSVIYILNIFILSLIMGHDLTLKDCGLKADE